MDHSTMEKLLNVDEKSIATTAAIDWLKLNFENKQTNFIINKKKQQKQKILSFFFYLLELQLELTSTVVFRTPIPGGKAICIPHLNEQDGTVKWLD